MFKDRTVAVFRLSALGDIALTTGVLDYWHRERGLSFIFFTRPGPALVLREHPAVQQVVLLDGKELQGMRWFSRAGELARIFSGMVLIDLHGTLRSRILSLRWKGPVRRYPKFGLERRLFNRFGWNGIRGKLEQTSVTQRYALALEAAAPSPLELLPLISLNTAESSSGTLRLMTATGALKSEHDLVVALHPYATHPDKAWPREHWTQLAAQLSQAGLKWIVVGHDSSPLFPGDPRDFTNRTTLRETCALLRAADLLVTNDSGPMHLAAGVGTAVVALFGPTSKAWGFYPQGPNDHILQLDMSCRPCTLHGSNQCTNGRICLLNILPAQVLQAVLDGLEAITKFTE